MTPVRRVAMKVSGLVVRYASSGCKEWAEGLAREVEFIVGDWAAFWWAIGSTRVLLDRPEAPMTSLTDVRDGARRLSKSVRKRTSGYPFLFLYAFYSALKLMGYDALKLTGAASLQQRIGYGLIAVAAICMAITLLMRRRMQQAPQSADLGTWVLYYRTELERQRDFYRSGVGMVSYATVILFLGGSYLVCSGFIPKADVRTYLLLGWCCVLLIGCLVSSSVWQWLKFQEQIDALTAKLKGAR
jgi:hypothetical protein